MAGSMARYCDICSSSAKNNIRQRLSTPSSFLVNRMLSQNLLEPYHKITDDRCRPRRFWSLVKWSYF